MQNTRKIFKLILHRSIYTSPTQNGIGKTMNKVMKQPRKKKPFFEDVPAIPRSKTFDKVSSTSKPQGNKRRINTLNKLFMRHITDLMATGEMSSTYAGLGLEINRVEITPDFLGVNVFWVAKNNDKQIDIEEMLKDTGRKLKYELTWLRVIGNVPNIHFIRDKLYAQMIEVDNRLAKADLGDDYETTDSIQRLKTQLLLNMNLKPEVKEEIIDTKENDKNVFEDDKKDVPDMPQDVLGLNHKDIMDRIKVSMKKTRSKTQINFNNSLNEINTQPIEFKSVKMQRDAFKEFLAERQILKRKIRKEKSKISPELEYFKNEYLELKEKEFESLQFGGIDDDKDYIEEDIDDSELRYK